MKTATTIIEESLAQCEIAYPQHCRFNPITDTFVNQWKEKLGGYSDETLKRAFSDHLTLSEKFPTLFDIRNLANKHSKHLRDERAQDRNRIEHETAFDDFENKQKVAKRSIEIFNQLVKESASNPKKEHPKKRPDSVNRGYADGRPINTILRTDLKSGIQYEYIQFLDTNHG